jgi:hypothetical protein
MTPTIELPAGIDPAMILDAFHRRTLTAETEAALANEASPRHALAVEFQEKARALVDSLQQQEQLRTEGAALTAVSGRFAARLADLDRRLAEEHGRAAAAMIHAARDGERHFAKFTPKTASLDSERRALLGDPIPTDEVSRQLGSAPRVHGAIEIVAGQALANRRALKVAEVEHLRVDGEYHFALADMIFDISKEKAAGAVAFEGSLTIDPKAGKSGAARAHSAHLLARYRELRRDLDQELRGDIHPKSN